MVDLTPLTGALGDFTTKVTLAVKKQKVPRVRMSDNADTLNNLSVAQMQAQVDAVAKPHIDSRANPHNTTANQVNAYTKAEVDALLAGLLPAGMAPFSRFGTLDDEPISFSAVREGPGVRVASTWFNFPVVIAGTFMYAQEFSFLVMPDPGQTMKTIYLYGTRQSHQWGVPGQDYLGITWTPFPLASEDADNMYLGDLMVDMNIGYVAVSNVTKFSRLGNNRVSRLAKGWSIPVSLGPVSQPASLEWS